MCPTVALTPLRGLAALLSTPAGVSAGTLADGVVGAALPCDVRVAEGVDVVDEDSAACSDVLRAAAKHTSCVSWTASIMRQIVTPQCSVV